MNHVVYIANSKCLSDILNSSKRISLTLLLVFVFLLAGCSSTTSYQKNETQSNKPSLKFEVFPETYTSVMSSTLGIRISAKYSGAADKVEYSTTYGVLLTWNSASSKINEHGQKVLLPLSMPIYWSPLVNDINEEKVEIVVKAAIFKNNNELVQKNIKIRKESPTSFYTVISSNDVIIVDNLNPQSQNPKTIDEAVSLAIKAQGKGYYNGEVVTEGHITLDVEEKGEIVKVYTVSSISWFGFENGIFTGISGSGAIPTVITFSKNQSGEYLLLEYKEPMDGAGYSQSIKNMFPKKLWDKVFTTEKYPEIPKQMETQAKDYLQSIGRISKVSLLSVEKKPVNINVEASNKIFAEYMKYDSELNKFPYWIGSKEMIENGDRYIFETSQSKTNDGYDLITFKKIKEDGNVVKQYQYKIIGNKVHLLVND